MSGYDIEKILERLKIALKATNDAELGKFLNVPQQSINQAKKKQRVPPVWIEKTSFEYGISSDWLYFGIGPMRRGEETESPIYNGAGRPLDSEDYVYVPLAESRLAAGNGAPVLDHEEPLDIISFRRPWVSRVASSANNLVAFFVEGDSMTPTLEDGDLVLIDQGRTQLRTGAVFAVCVGGDLLQIKRLEVIGEKVRVIADNKNYPVAELPPERVLVIGQVVWFCRELVRRK